MQDSIPWLRFAGSADASGADPGEANEAVGDADAVRATALGLKNLARVARLIPSAAASARAGQPLNDLEELYESLVNQWATELSHVARIPGGFSRHEKATGQAGAVYAPLSRARQREAVAFLNTHAFRTPRFLIDPAVLRRLEASGSVARIGAAQRRVLDVLLNTARLQRMVDAEAVDGSAVHTRWPISSATCARGVWRELETGAPIDPYRRRLQRGYPTSWPARSNRSRPRSRQACPPHSPRRSRRPARPTRARSSAASSSTSSERWAPRPTARAIAPRASTSSPPARRSTPSSDPRG
jgi:hypothetical protein